LEQVLEKWLGKEACSTEEFDGIDLTNRLGADKVLFKVRSIEIIDYLEKAVCILALTSPTIVSST
jgi:hypothetical protein